MTPSASPSTPDAAPGMLTRLRTQAAAMLAGVDDRARTQRNAIFAFSVRVVSAALLYLSQAALARWMGSFEFGIYVFVWTWVLLLGGLSHGGLATAMIRLVPEYAARDEHDLLRGLLVGGRLLAVALATLIAGLAGAMLWAFSTHLSGPYLMPLFLALVCVPLYALSDVQDGIGRGKAWMGLALVPPYILRPLLLLATMAAAWLAGLPMTAVTAVGAAIVATWLAAITQTLMISRRLAGEPQASGPRRFAVGTWLATALPLLVIGGCEMLLQTADVLIISRYMSPSDVAIYYAAAKTMALVLFVQYAVGSAVANRFAALNAVGDEAGLARTLADAVRWTFWPSLAAALVILALGRPLLALFGPQFVAAYPVMFILIVGFLVRAAMGPAEYLLNMLGEQRRCARALAIAAAVDIALALLLVPSFGLIGAAIATATAYATAALLAAREVRRRLGMPISIFSVAWRANAGN